MLNSSLLIVITAAITATIAGSPNDIQQLYKAMQNLK
jgi:hypothetical protein